MSQREWSADGRRYFRYEMDTPILNFWSVLSARYAVARDKWNDVDIAIYFHPGHDANVPRMIDAVKESLAYYSANFGPYQHRQMRIVEFPGYFGLAQSFPNTVPYSEAIGFITDNRNPDTIDYVWYLTAHEVAHQWWGHQVAGAAMLGERFLSETLSQYSALMVMERRYGAAHMRRFLSYELDQYLLAARPPRASASFRSSASRRRCTSTTTKARSRCTRSRTRSAKRRSIACWRSSCASMASRPAPTRRLRISSACCARRSARSTSSSSPICSSGSRSGICGLSAPRRGRPTTSGGASASTCRPASSYADAQGNEKEAPLDQAIDIGLFSADPRGRGFSAKDVIVVDKRRIVSGKQSIELIVDQRPAFVGVDPYIKLIQRNTRNNVAPLASSPTN